MKITRRLLHILPVLCLICLVLPGYTADGSKGEKITPAPGLQVIGDGGAGRLRSSIAVFEQFAGLEKEAGVNGKAIWYQ